MAEGGKLKAEGAPDKKLQVSALIPHPSRLSGGMSSGHSVIMSVVFDFSFQFSTFRFCHER